jgi:hypothetical protein
MIGKEFCKKKYVELKSKSDNDNLPKKSKYLQFCGIDKRKLDALFGSNPYSKLQAECGDKPNKLYLTRVASSKIFDQWGELARQHGRIPTQADWLEAELKPSPDGLAKRPHSIKWSDLPKKFLEYAKNKSEWHDVVSIIKRSTIRKDKSTPRSRNFEELVSIIKQWTPDRKRNFEETYKPELKNHLQNKKYLVKEEKGEGNPDLLVDRIYPIELKKDPSLSEYDRLFGQLIRQGLHYEFAIAVIANASSSDRFDDFSKNVECVFPKLNINVKLILKGT